MQKEQAKLYEAQRNVKILEVVDWSKLIDSSHPACRIVRVLEEFDLKDLYTNITSEKSCKGRPAIDPKIMLAILVYAAMKGLSSSRVIAAQCKWEPGFRWILGHGLSVEYVSISTFRKEAGKSLDNILTQVITAMVSCGVVDLDEVILDGTKIKANAGRGSFRTKQELQSLHKEVTNKLKRMSLEEKKKNQKAKLKDQKDRVQKALDQIPEIQEALNEGAKKKKKGAKAADAKASSTDVDARQMRFADGSRGPGYNAQFMTAPKSGVIVDVKVTQRRNDSNMLIPMLDSFEGRYGKSPKRILGDSGYTTQVDVTNALDRGIGVYCPQKKDRKGSKAASKKRLERKRSKEPDVLREWRVHMETEAAKKIRSRRIQTEKVHGWIKSKLIHGQLELRGLAGAQIELLLYSIGYNLMRYFNMTPLRAS